MEKTTKGWVVRCINHPTSGASVIVESTFSRLRNDAIAKFVAGSENEWEYWREKYHYQVVKADAIIRIEEPIL